MIIRIRNSRWTKVLSLLMGVQLLLFTLLPQNLMAITGGPSQPEFSSFTPVGVSEMVDLFTGDFQYNIPLMDVGGYPINLSYASGIGMEQQASNVGLGWRLNAGGEINRSMRGIPDDFNSNDKIIKRNNLKINLTAGANLTLTPELIGKELDAGKKLGASLSFGMFYNTYKGLGYDFSVNPVISISDMGKSDLNLGLGLSANSQSGVSIRPRLSLDSQFSGKTKDETIGMTSSLGIGSTYNSRAGLKAIAFDASIKSDKGFTSKVKDGENSRNKGFNEKGSSGIGTSIPIGMSTYVPNVSTAMSSTSFAADFGTGAELFWANAKVKIGGYYNEQHIKKRKVDYPAAGYLYAGNSLPNSIHDFNREKDGVVSSSTPHIAMAQATYDIYNVTGQGVGGMYRPYRDAGTVYDPYVNSGSHGGSLGGDFGATQLVKAGINVSYNYSSSTSGRWSGDKSESLRNIDYKKSNTVENKPNEYEPFYFKNAGEFSIVNDIYLDKIGNLDPMRVEITKNGSAKANFKRRVNLDDKLEGNKAITDLKRGTREKRNQNMSVLTAKAADKIGLEENMLSYAVNTGNGVVLKEPIARIDNNRKGHHISEITINRNDGARYVYGIQQYNYKQLEESFNVNGLPDCINGFVSYVPGLDNSIKNKKGTDRYFSSTELPAYGTAYMLTAVLSTDYVDVKGDGLTDDDLGNYTKFNYTQVYGGNKGVYKWRNPYGENLANYSEGYKSKSKDDKGNYVYGEKEIWEIQSIETKQYIAEFYYLPRKDAYGVKSKNGGRSNSTLNKLDRIELYVKCDRQKNGANATALKKVYFEYDYSLCRGIPSNIDNNPYPPTDPTQGGKLTLKKVYFTYEDSEKGKLSPYQFHYADHDHDKQMEAANNPDYSFRGNDRWGNYKPNQGLNCDIANTPLTNIEDPYVEQNKEKADLYTAAWHLSTIQLPSGGIIKVDYESDDYAYVQDKSATQMFKVLGFSNTNSSSKNNLVQKLYHGINNNYQYIYFDIDDEITSETAFREKYFGKEGGRIKELFYKFLIDITGKSEYEYVSGYATVVNTGFYNDGGDKLGWIELKSVQIQDVNLGDKIHPIAKTAMQFAQINLPEKIFGGEEKQIVPTLAFFNFLISTIKDITQMVIGANRYLALKHFGKYVKPDKSFIRLQTPNYKKLGGGVRVKRIAINDGWSTMSGPAGNKTKNFDYGQTYDYTTIDDDGIEKSSGVAAYEPFIGNEENPCRQPVAYSEKAKLAPDNSYYQETPYGESFYPSPTVGYSKVKVTNLARSGVKRTATGYVQHEFYTAKDFPVKVRRPKTDVQKHKSGLIGRLFGNSVDNLTVSQSHVIELNDMHGKPKAMWVFAEDQSQAISGLKYSYKTKNNNGLSNELTVINKRGEVLENKRGGIEIDMINDERESKQSTFGVFIPTDIDVSLLPFPTVPIPIPSVWPKVTRENTRYRSLSNTKVITRYGILEETEAFDLGSRVRTKNIAWDAETGEVLLTEVQNDFEDPIYAFTYPAHWGYEGMGPSYKNIGLKVKIGAGDGTGLFHIPNGTGKFVPGDEVLVEGSKLWIVDVDGNQIQLKDIDGNPPGIFDSDATMEVVRSGRRNQQSIPIGNVLTLTNPIANKTSLKFEKILNAGAVEFKDDWAGFCECEGLLASTNPYVNGNKGNYRAKKSHLYLTGRNQSNQNRNSNIRKDGVFRFFDPFWNPALNPNPNFRGEDWKVNKSQWTFTTEVTLVSPFGLELENRDTLNRYSAADYRYKNSLPTAVASNARYKEIGFDNFEDYECDNCTDDHFSFKKSSANIDETEAHTGRRSISVSPGQKVSVEKTILNCKDMEPIPLARPAK